MVEDYAIRNNIEITPLKDLPIPNDEILDAIFTTVSNGSDTMI